MQMGLTQKQTQAYSVIRAHIMAHGMSPSVEEICTAMNMKSKSGAFNLIRSLKERGWIDFIPYRSRSIVLLNEPVVSTIDLTNPLLRQALIAAGWQPPKDK